MNKLTKLSLIATILSGCAMAGKVDLPNSINDGESAELVSGNGLLSNQDRVVVNVQNKIRTLITGKWFEAEAKKYPEGTELDFLLQDDVLWGENFTGLSHCTIFSNGYMLTFSGTGELDINLDLNGGTMDSHGETDFKGLIKALGTQIIVDGKTVCSNEVYLDQATWTITNEMQFNQKISMKDSDYISSGKTIFNGGVELRGTDVTSIGEMTFCDVVDFENSYIKSLGDTTFTVNVEIGAGVNIIQEAGKTMKFEKGVKLCQGSNLEVKGAKLIIGTEKS